MKLKCIYCSTMITLSDIDEEIKYAKCPKCACEYGLDYAYSFSTGTTEATLIPKDDEQ